MLTRGAERARAENAQATTASTTKDDGATKRRKRVHSDVEKEPKRLQPSRTVKDKGVQQTHLQLAGTGRKDATRSKHTKKAVKAQPAAKKVKKVHEERPAKTAAKAENSSEDKDEAAESTPAPIQSKEGATTKESDCPSTKGTKTRAATASSSGETLVERSQTPKVKATRSMVAIEDFDWVRDLGAGGTAKVYLCRKKDSKQHYALKAIQKNTIRSSASRKRILNEQRLLEHLAVGNPFVIKLRESFHNETHLFLALDYHSGGDLLSAWTALGGSLDAKVVKFWTMEMVAGLSSIHKCGIVHRDMKPENVLIDCDGHIVITDFGMAKQLQERTSDTEQSTYETTNSYCGTELYMSPEIIQGLQYSFSSDWWSLGIMMHEMLLADLPFCKEEERNSCMDRVLDRIVHEDLQFPQPPEISTKEEDLVRELLNKDHEARISEDGIKGHRYFAGIKWKRVDLKGYTPPYIPDMDPPEQSDDEYVCMGIVLESEKGKKGRGSGERGVSEAI
ncbi:kinase-like protein [Cylindrobasidium torrendii FP15055 ss-10]|uniref:non-specific serine/threonine protein kinase n=1 Tax=Cylindrobasidium torrendii FP15055 ss-10 TaxID=1314674 RepID=A0A0D7BD52_9AGAR|nr:kinase-like protein [Cylindrobasidium torrendii FP15055 ss-10]